MWQLPRKVARTREQRSSVRRTRRSSTGVHSSCSSIISSTTTACVPSRRPRRGDQRVWRRRGLQARSRNLKQVDVRTQRLLRFARTADTDAARQRFGDLEAGRGRAAVVMVVQGRGRRRVEDRRRLCRRGGIWVHVQAHIRKIVILVIVRLVFVLL